MLETQHYHLKKPEPDIDPADVQVINENMDNIDEVVGGHLGDKDRHTSADEKARLERELAGKATGDHTGAALNSNALGNIDANKFSRIIGTFRRGDDVLDRLLQMAVSGSFEVLSGAINVPDSTKYYTGSIDYVHGGRATIRLSCLIAPFPKYQIDLVDNAWTGWKQLAAAEPPQEFNLPLSSGITGSIKYYANQFGKKNIDGTAGHPTNVFASGQVLGILPIGFRPVFQIQRTVNYYSVSGGFIAGTMIISTSGELIPQFLFPSGVNWAYMCMEY